MIGKIYQDLVDKDIHSNDANNDDDDDDDDDDDNNNNNNRKKGKYVP